MDEAIRKFESYLNRRYPNSSTAKNYVNDLHIFARFADKPPRQVTKSDVAHFVEQQLAGGRAPTTINRRLASLHHFFEFLADETDDDTWANPVVWRQQRVKEGKPLPRDISDADVEQLWACIQHPRDRLMFGLMYGLGLRVGEVAALQVADLIPASDPRQGARLRVCGKGQKERVVPVPPPSCPALGSVAGATPTGGQRCAVHHPAQERVQYTWYSGTAGTLCPASWGRGHLPPTAPYLRAAHGRG